MERLHLPVKTSRDILIRLEDKLYLKIKESAKQRNQSTVMRIRELIVRGMQKEIDDA